MGRRFVPQSTINRRMAEKDDRFTDMMRERALTPETLTLTVSPGGDGICIAEVSGIPLGPGPRWTAQAEQRRIAEGELLRRFPDAVVTGAATANDHAYILWFRSGLVA